MEVAYASDKRGLTLASDCSDIVGLEWHGVDGWIMVGRGRSQRASHHLYEWEERTTTTATSTGAAAVRRASEQTRFPISRRTESHMRDSLSRLLSHLLIGVHHLGRAPERIER